MRLLRDLWSSAPRSTAAVALVLGVGALSSALASTVAGKVLIDRSRALFGVLAVLLVLSVASQVLAGLLMARITAQWSGSLRRRLIRKAFGQPLTALDATPAGELLDRIDNDVYDIGSQLRGPLLRLAAVGALGIAGIVAAAVIWWPVGLGAVLLMLALWLALRGRIAQISPLRLREEEAWSDIAAVTEEAIHGQDDVRTSLAQPYVMTQYSARAHALLERGSMLWKASANISGIASMAVLLALAAFVLGGTWALTTARLDPARLTSLWLLTLGIGGTVVVIARMMPEAQSALGAWTRIQLLVDAPQEPDGGVEPQVGELAIRGLTFGYADADATTGPVLRDVTLTFQPGRSYALIGRTGSGKSTIAKVLTRAVEVPHGTVFLAGRDINDLKLSALRRNIALLPQRTDILTGSLAENITLFDPDLTGRVPEVLAELGLTDWVAELPDGVDTHLGNDGHVLSAGQEQLVAFARILLRRPEIVVLDEATARLDPATEVRVQQSLERLLTGRIGVIIAHRLSTVRHCDEVVVLADGQVIEAGPLASSELFGEWMALGGLDDAAAPAAVPAPRAGRRTSDRLAVPPLPEVAPVRTLREIVRLSMNDPRYGLAAVLVWASLTVIGINGSLLPALWARLVDGEHEPWLPAVAIAAILAVSGFEAFFTGWWFGQWWVRQMLRIGARLVHGQTGPRRRSAHSPAEVVAQAGDTERVIILADNVFDLCTAAVSAVVMAYIAQSLTPSLIFLSALVLSALMAGAFARPLAVAARRTVDARAGFASGLVSSLTAARTIKLAGAQGPVLAHLARLDAVRNERQYRELALQVWARSSPRVFAGLLPLAAWALYLNGALSSAATLITVSTLGAAEWFAWTAASLVSALPSARVWTARTVVMSGAANYSAMVPGVDFDAGTGPAPDVRPRSPLRTLRLTGFTAVHEDGTVGARDVDLTVRQGDLVLVVGEVGSGKSSLLRALAGVVHHVGELTWNGELVRRPEVFLRPDQVGYVAQLPRVLSGSIADNIALGHDVPLEAAVATAQLEHDLAVAGQGTGLRVGHRGTRLSGGQVQRVALARALAPGTELLIADDISSALDVTTELALWQALRSRGTTVIGSTSKRSALALADQVVVMDGGRVVGLGTWAELEARWSHLAG